MLNLEREVLHKMEIKAFEQGDLQTLRLVKEIKDLRTVRGVERAKFERNRAKYSHQRQREVEKAFSHGVTAMRELFPELPPVSLDNIKQTVSIYVPADPKQGR